MSAPTIEPTAEPMNVGAVLAVLERELTAIPAPHELPRHTTPAELDHIEGRRSFLRGRISAIRNATDTLAEVEPRIQRLEEWREHLERWRQPLCDEFLALPARVRTDYERGRLQNLKISIQTIDRGVALEETGYMLETLRLGELMRESGFQQSAPTAGQTMGRLPWFGSLADVASQLKTLTKRRDDARAQLAEALLTDAARAERAAADAARHAELRARPTRKTRGDGSVYDKYPDGRIVEIAGHA